MNLTAVGGLRLYTSVSWGMTEAYKL